VVHPETLTPALRSSILEAIELGVSYRKACAAHGVAWSTFTDTKKREPEGFALDVAKADALGCLFHAKRLRETECPVQMRASIFFLSTHDRPKFSQRYEIGHTGRLGLSIVDLLHGSAAAAVSGDPTAEGDESDDES
jgi:hypothetical protein